MNKELWRQLVYILICAILALLVLSWCTGCTIVNCNVYPAEGATEIHAAVEVWTDANPTLDGTLTPIP